MFPLFFPFLFFPAFVPVVGGAALVGAGLLGAGVGAVATSAAVTHARYDNYYARGGYGPYSSPRYMENYNYRLQDCYERRVRREDVPCRYDEDGQKICLYHYERICYDDN